jgi:hypothetical protein
MEIIVPSDNMGVAGGRGGGGSGYTNDHLLGKILEIDRENPLRRKNLMKLIVKIATPLDAL